ncbi:MAG: hypothetical protein A3H27_09065 [Acidobacteria bacterium RIFCSPLOWO2_02_FULL_59_13]|nr:MAG: hypothetical protein A3H27_09065 [Acidobacteria bacterium RIFCSPLOWO2_02_FULL_59_13]
MIVAFAAGSGPDIVARLISQNASTSLGQPLLVDNRPGANGLLALEAAAKAAPDGYTIAFADVGHLSINPSLYARLPYDPDRDFAPVTIAYATPFYVFVNSKSPYRSLADLIAAAKASPNTLTHGSAGNGSLTHIFMEQLKQKLEIPINHVPFKSGPQMAAALLSGDVDSAVTGMAAVRGMVDQGRIRPLAVTSGKRSSSFPNIPAVSETKGAEGFDSSTWVAFIAPSNTDAGIINRLNTELVKAVNAPEVRAKLLAQSFEPWGTSPEYLRARMRDDRNVYSRIVKATGARLD